MNLSTTYMGLELASPLVPGASPLTATISKIRRMEELGAGAVVLRSLFEEQIRDELDAHLDEEDMYFWYPEAAEHIRNLSRAQKTKPYLRLIEQAKSAVGMPVIASINCFSAGNWIAFATEMQNAGADGLELNVATHLPYDDSLGPGEIEKRICDVVEGITSRLDIPVAVKIGPYYSNLIETARMLAQAGAKALVLFNRFYRPDIDIETMQVISDRYLSVPGELTESLRWIGVVSGHVSCDLAASTGIHSHKGVVKQLLAGATVTQLCSVLYQKGIDEIGVIRRDLEQWMHQKGFDSVDRFRGRIVDTRLRSARFEQLQFIEKNEHAL
jgi:dihydroorotate dehydrogenase (fumarate)